MIREKKKSQTKKAKYYKIGPSSTLCGKEKDNKRPDYLIYKSVKE